MSLGRKAQNGFLFEFQMTSWFVKVSLLLKAPKKGKQLSIFCLCKEAVLSMKA